MSTSASATGFLSLFPGEQLVAQYMVVDRPRKLTLADFVVAAFLLLYFIIPGLLFLFLVWLFRNRREGYLVLTNQRLGYYEKAENKFGVGHTLFQVNLENVEGVSADYTKSWGNENVVISILTSYGDGFSTLAGKRGSIFAFLNRWLPSSMGKDVHSVQRALYAQIDSIRTGRQVVK